MCIDTEKNNTIINSGMELKKEENDSEIVAKIEEEEAVPKTVDEYVKALPRIIRKQFNLDA